MEILVYLEVQYKTNPAIISRRWSGDTKVLQILEWGLFQHGISASHSEWLICHEGKNVDLSNSLGQLCGHLCGKEIRLFAIENDECSNSELDLSLEEERAMTGGGSDSEFELYLDVGSPLDRESATEDGSSSEAELTLDDSGSLASLQEEATAEEKDIFETDFEVPALEEAVEEAVLLNESETDQETSDFELSQEEGEAAVEGESGSQIVTLDEDEGATETDASVARPRAPGSDSESDIDVEVINPRPSLDETVDYRKGCGAAPVMDEAEAEAEEEEEEEVAARKAQKKPGKKRKACVVTKARRSPAKFLKRHAAVRYYNRMNPDRMYPLLIAITRDAVPIPSKQKFDQRSKEVKLTPEQPVVVEPVLPGCDCYPTRQQVQVGKADIKVTFYVVPRVVGQVIDARVLLTQGDREVSQLSLDMRVSNRGAVIFMAICSLLLPFLSALMKHFRVDFESQLQDGFDLYLFLARSAISSPPPGLLMALFLGFTVLLYLFLRPRRKNLFWDLSRPGLQIPKESIWTRAAKNVGAGGRAACYGGAFGLVVGLLLVTLGSRYGSMNAMRALIVVGFITVLAAVLAMIGWMAEGFPGVADDSSRED